jgi:hypothetical protein
MLSPQSQSADDYAENPPHSFVLYAIGSLFPIGGYSDKRDLTVR